MALEVIAAGATAATGLVATVMALATAAAAATAVTAGGERCRSPHRALMTAGIRCVPAPSVAMLIGTTGAGAGTRIAGCGWQIREGDTDRTVLLIAMMMRRLR